jgi:hypothetical protein
MSENGWRTARMSEVEPLPGMPQDLQGWLPLRHRLGVQAFGVNAWVAGQDGDEVIEEHDELNENPADNHQELYVVVEGRATFTVDGNEVDAPRGTLVFVEDPSIVRKAVAHSAGTTVLAIGATPGEAFEPSPWEQRRIDGAAA